MSRSLNKLSATAVRNARPKDKTYRLADGGGLYLEVTPAGGVYWRMKYRFHGKEKRLAVGVFGDGKGKVSLAQARKARDEAKALLAQGVDPSTAKRLAKLESLAAAGNTFKAVATDWLDRIHQHDVVEGHYRRNKRRLERDIFPALGHRPIAEITPLELLECLRKIEKRGHLETAQRVRVIVSQIYRHAIIQGKVERDTAADLKGALRQAEVKHHAAITEPDELPPLLRAIDGFRGYPTTAAMLKLAPLTLARPGELRQARWADIDLQEAAWSFSASKTGQPHIVPLPTQAVEILRGLHPLTGRGDLVFPGIRDRHKPMTDSVFRDAMKAMGFAGRMTGHGFRAMARTILAERLGFPDHIIEQQLAHKVKDSNGRAYNRTKFLEQRREMLQSWADYLDALRAGAGNVVPIRGQA